eukprot:9503405-Pyramimonas_sp.AAC.1
MMLVDYIDTSSQDWKHRQQQVAAAGGCREYAILKQALHKTTEPAQAEIRELFTNSGSLSPAPWGTWGATRDAVGGVL